MREGPTFQTKMDSDRWSCRAFQCVSSIESALELATMRSRGSLGQARHLSSFNFWSLLMPTILITTPDCHSSASATPDRGPGRNSCKIRSLSFVFGGYKGQTAAESSELSLESPWRKQRSHLRKGRPESAVKSAKPKSRLEAVSDWRRSLN